MSNLKELIDEYLELEENFDEDNEKEAEKLHELGHEIDHLVFEHEFVIVSNSSGDEEEVVALIVGPDEEHEEYFIPVYTDEEEAKIAIETFKEETGQKDFSLDVAPGNAIVEAYSEDEEFLGLAINAPQYDFVIFSENVHQC